MVTEATERKEEQGPAIYFNDRFRIELKSRPDAFIEKLRKSLNEKYPLASDLLFQFHQIKGYGVYEPARLVFGTGINFNGGERYVIVEDQVTQVTIEESGNKNVPTSEIFIRDVGIPYIVGDEVRSVPTQKDASLRLHFTDWTGEGHISFSTSVSPTGKNPGALITSTVDLLNNIVQMEALNLERLPSYQEY